MDIKNNPKLKKIFSALGGGLILVLLVLNVISDFKKYDAVEKISKQPSILIIPLITMSVAAIFAILYKEKKITFNEHTINIFKMVASGFAVIVDIVWIIFFIVFFYYAIKIAKWFTLEEILHEMGIELNSTLTIILVLIILGINLGYFVYILKKFLKYFWLIKNKNSKIINNNHRD